MAAHANAHAYATYIIRNDSYVPGALVLAHTLREMETPADLVCLVAPEVSRSACNSLETLYDAVIRVEPINLSACRDQRRQHLSQVLTRVNVLRLGADGDLGCRYTKVVLLDADVLPLRCFDHLFAVPTPAGILNERSEYLKRTDSDRRYSADRSRLKWGRWEWHHVYRRMGHGEPIPTRVTDRVLEDPDNYGVNSAVLVVTPSMDEYRSMRDDLECCADTQEMCAGFRWPDMQYLTARWSGLWHNVDACFAGIGGYPSIDLLFGTHFAGLKPWQVRHRSVVNSFSRFPDFQRWYAEYLAMSAANPALRDNPRLASLAEEARTLLAEPAKPVIIDP